MPWTHPPRPVGHRRIARATRSRDDVGAAPAMTDHVERVSGVSLLPG